MKTLVLFFALLFTGFSFAQTGINYKAVVKDGSGNILANQTIRVVFIIVDETGPAEEYVELHVPTTDANGNIILIIGEGGQLSGDFSEIDWRKDIYSLQTLIDIENGGEFVDLGKVPFKKVPHSFSAEEIAEAPNRVLKIGGSGTQKLQVDSQTGGNSSIELIRTGANTDWGIENSGDYLDILKSDDDFTTDDLLFTFQKDGRLGINTSIPSKELHVNGEIRASSLSGPGMKALAANPNGDIVVDIEEKHLSLNPSIFNSNHPGANANSLFLSGDAGANLGYGGNIALPHGATITRFKVYFVDNSANVNMKFHLMAKSVTKTTNGPGPVLSSSGASSSNRSLDSGPISIVVDNITNSYVVNISCIPVPLGWDGFLTMVTGVVITYILP